MSVNISIINLISDIFKYGYTFLRFRINIFYIPLFVYNLTFHIHYIICATA